jgi:hypothetical protein
MFSVSLQQNPKLANLTAINCKKFQNLLIDFYDRFLFLSLTASIPVCGYRKFGGKSCGTILNVMGRALLWTFPSMTRLRGPLRLIFHV